MKIFKTLLFLAAMSFMTACSNSAGDEEFNSQSQNFQTKSTGSIVVGTVDSNGNYVVTMDTSDVKRLWEAELAKSGITVAYTDFVIEERIPENDSSQIDYLLIGYDSTRSISTATIVNKVGLSFVVADESSLVKTITCDGCQYGCNITTVRSNGKVRKYCSSGCGSDCRKIETETY